MIDYLIQGLRGIHIVAGFVGLIAFWIPLFAKKGSINHKRIGKIFINAGYIVVWAGAISISIKLAMLFSNNEPFTAKADSIGFALFLGYLCITTGTILRHGILVLFNKKDPTLMDSFINKTLAYSCLIASGGIIAYGALSGMQSPIILYALSPIGVLTFSQIRRYISQPAQSKQSWWYEHLSSLIISGIAFHTAFAVFGSRAIIDLGLSGSAAIIPWIAPTFIGVPAMIIWEQYYRKKFNDPRGKKAA